MTTPQKKHRFTAPDGTVREYLMVLDDEHCESCNPYGQRENGVYGVIEHGEGYSSWECLNCANSVTRDPKEVEFKHPKIKQAVLEAKLKEQPL